MVPVRADVARVLRLLAVLAGAGAAVHLVQALAGRRERPGAHGLVAARPRPPLLVRSRRRHRHRR